jgi:hypothetical protein
MKAIQNLTISYTYGGIALYGSQFIDGKKHH